MFKVSESERKVLVIWAVLGIIIFMLVLLLCFKKSENNEEAMKITADNSNYIVDYNRYYTVKNAITKFYSFINAKDNESIYKILNEKYIKEYDITEDSVMDYFTETEDSLSYQSARMCLKSVKDGVYSFVIEGVEIKANTGEEINDMYYEVVLDGNTSLFSIKPIDNDDFEGVCNG